MALLFGYSAGLSTIEKDLDMSGNRTVNLPNPVTGSEPVPKQYTHKHYSGSGRGTQGPKVDTGSQGPEGPKGDIGPEGPKGDTRAQGPKGDIGPEGPKRTTGAQGSEGPKGTTGAQGPKGDTGSRGPRGHAGSGGLSASGFTMQSNIDMGNNKIENVADPCWRIKFRFRRRSDTSKMADHLINLVLKPMCLIKLIDFSF